MGRARAKDAAARDRPLRITGDERSALKRRMGAAPFEKRIRKEDTRELKFGGMVRWCPMKVARPVATFLFKALGFWKRGRRNYLDIRVREETFAVRGLHPDLEGFTLLFLSDLHVDLDPDFPAALRAAVESVRGRYDAAAVAGDFNNFTAHADTRALRLATDLATAFSAPVYGVLGNHDSVRDVPFFESRGIRILLNEGVVLRRGAGRLLLAGVDDPNIFGTHDLARALRPGGGAMPSVLLAHAPSIHREAAEAGVDVVLCGHVHGGQICTRSGRTLAWRHWRFPRRVWRGRWTEGGTQGYTTTGAGACGVPLRFNCPPEIVLVRFVRAAGTPS